MKIDNLKKDFIRFGKDERGFGLSILFLLIIPLLVMMILSTVDNKRSMRVITHDLQSGLDQAVRASTMQVDPQLQALGVMAIDPVEAHNTFRDNFSYNLITNELVADTADEYTEGLSSISNISYSVVVFNTVDYGTLLDTLISDPATYTPDPDADMSDPDSWVSWDADLEEIRSIVDSSNIVGNYFILDHSSPLDSNVVGSQGIVGGLFDGTSGTVTVNPALSTYLDFNTTGESADTVVVANVGGGNKFNALEGKPGVLVVVEADIRTTLEDEPNRVRRWAYAEIKLKNLP